MIYFIDASVYVFRAYYSVPPDMHDPHGNPVHALYGFGRFLGDLIERVRPDYLAVAFDESAARSWRSQIYPRYKAHREPPPADLVLQFGLCRELCRHLGVPHFASDEYEADDIIGTLATMVRAEGSRCTVVSRDKDLAQLVRAGDVYWDYASNSRYAYHDIERRFGVAPEHYADYLALTGDSVDNIPGVPGVGPKTAATLMKTFGSLDALYEKLELVAQLPVRGAAALAATLAEHRATAFLSRRLTAIHCQVPLGITRQHLRRQPPDFARLDRFCDAQGFGLMLRRQAQRIAQLAA